MMTKEEIAEFVLTLRKRASLDNEEIPYRHINTVSHMAESMPRAIDIITQQQAEIEDLRKHCSHYDGTHSGCRNNEKKLMDEITELKTKVCISQMADAGVGESITAELSRLRKIEEAAKAHLSYMTPEEWRDHYGNNVFKSIVDGKLPTYFVCESPKGGEGK